jgi:hypothetical protein
VPDPVETTDPEGIDFAWVMQTTFVLTILLGAPIVALASIPATLPTWGARASFAIRVGAIVWIVVAIGTFVYERRNATRHAATRHDATGRETDGNGPVNEGENRDVDGTVRNNGSKQGDNPKQGNDPKQGGESGSADDRKQGKDRSGERAAPSAHSAASASSESNSET